MDVSRTSIRRSEISLICFSFLHSQMSASLCSRKYGSQNYQVMLFLAHMSREKKIPFPRHTPKIMKSMWTNQTWTMCLSLLIPIALIGQARITPTPEMSSKISLIRSQEKESESRVVSLKKEISPSPEEK